MTGDNPRVSRVFPTPRRRRLPGYAVAYCLFVGALRDIPATTAGLFINLVPVFAIVAASVLLDERPGGWQWIGAALVFSAMILVGRERRTSS